MKRDIHPDYHPVVYQDRSTGTAFLTRSTATSPTTVVWEDGNTYPLITLETTADSHPFWTGSRRVLDSEGRVERFRRRYGTRPSRGDHVDPAEQR